MKQTFDYLENVAFAATVCDKEGIALYQNAVARQRDGEVIGKNRLSLTSRFLKVIQHLTEAKNDRIRKDAWRRDL